MLSEQKNRREKREEKMERVAFGKERNRRNTHTHTHTERNRSFFA